MAEPTTDRVTPDPHPEPREGGDPPSPPSPTDPAESDQKLSRKREREVSVEPATPRADVVEIGPVSPETKDRRTPAKKNRIQLDITEEEDDGGPGTRTPPLQDPPMIVSPPHEIKVRLIRKGVEDLQWQTPIKVVQTDNAVREVAPLADPADMYEEDDSVAEFLLPETPASGLPKDDIVASDGADNSQDVVSESREEDPEPGTSPSRAHVLHASVHGRDSDSDGAEREKGIKRKFGARAISGNLIQTVEPLKRQRDDPDKDDNPRETKRPSPPPESAAPSPETGFKLSGFMAYASASSPFAAVKGGNIFKKPLFSVNPPSSSPFPKLTASVGPSTPTEHDVLKLRASPSLPSLDTPSGSSSAFVPVSRPKPPPSSSVSTFGSMLSKSPPLRANLAHASAFSSYATGGVQGFHVPKRARAASPSRSPKPPLERNASFASSNGAEDSATDEEEDEENPVSFGEKLRAGRDEANAQDSDEENKKPILTEQEISTGEEEEVTIYQVRGKLFALGSQSQWKERGTGTLKLNARRSDGGGARLVMRKEAVYTLLLNFTLFRGMRCFLAQDPRYLRFSTIEDGITTHYNLRVASAKVAQELLDEINANIPTTVCPLSM